MAPDLESCIRVADMGGGAGVAAETIAAAFPASRYLARRATLRSGLEAGHVPGLH